MAARLQADPQSRAGRGNHPELSLRLFTDGALNLGFRNSLGIKPRHEAQASLRVHRSSPRILLPTNSVNRRALSGPIVMRVGLLLGVGSSCAVAARASELRSTRCCRRIGDGRLGGTQIEQVAKQKNGAPACRKRAQFVLAIGYRGSKATRGQPRQRAPAMRC
jgi:hypothetical protein